MTLISRVCKRSPLNMKWRTKSPWKSLPVWSYGYTGGMTLKFVKSCGTHAFLCRPKKLRGSKTCAQDRGIIITCLCLLRDYIYVHTYLYGIGKYDVIFWIFAYHIICYVYVSTKYLLMIKKQTSTMSMLGKHRWLILYQLNAKRNVTLVQQLR